MSVPPSVVKVTKDGVEFTSSVDRVNYTLKELCRAALRDVGKLVCRRFREKYYGQFRRKSGRVGKYTQYFVKYKSEEIPSLEVGLKPNAFYGGFQELGSSRTQRRGLLQGAVEENIAEIVKVESQYLSAMGDEVEALSLISEQDYVGSGDG